MAFEDVLRVIGPELRPLFQGTKIGQDPVESPDGRGTGQTEQVRRTPAIRAAKFSGRYLGAVHTADDICPQMFIARPAPSEPDADDGCIPPEIIDVPAAVFFRPKMTAESGGQATRPPGTANVDIDAGAESKASQTADLNMPLVLQPHDQRIDSFIDWLPRRLQKKPPPSG